MTKTWPALLKDMPALWELLEPVWTGSEEGVRKDCAGQRGQAEKMLGLIKSMKESNFNPTLLDKDTLGLVLGDAEKGGDVASADLATARIDLHEKTAWMLRSTAA